MSQIISGIGAVAGLASGLLGAKASTDSADTQAQAAREAAALTQQRFSQVRNDLLPFIQGGYGSAEQLAQLTGTNAGGDPRTAFLTRMFQPQDLENTPGYQFTLDQGLKSVQNGYAAKGLASSGAAQKGAARYATGLAQNTYMQQLEADLKQRQNIFNMLFPQSTQGSGAAGVLGVLSNQTNAQSGAYMTDAAKAEAAGTIGQQNAFASILNPVAQYGIMYGIDPDGFKQSIYGPQRAQAPATVP